MSADNHLAGLGDRVRVFRKRLALSQRDLAKRARVNEATVLRTETGLVEARPSTIRKLAKALGVKPSDLMTAGELNAS